MHNHYRQITQTQPSSQDPRREWQKLFGEKGTERTPVVQVTNNWKSLLQQRKGK